MILSYKKIKLNVEFFSEFNPSNKSILFLHGFTGSADDWKEVAQKTNPAFNTIALDLIGHGKSSSPTDVNFYKSEVLVKLIFSVIEHLKIDKVILCGYSMGGRAALTFASVYPEKILTLILESTSAGIENEDERKIRIIRDEQLADFIESHSIEEFVDKWMEMEIFKSLQKLQAERLQNLKIAKLQNSKTGLANSLRGFGTGVMPYLGNDIKKMSFPVLLLTGELDLKFLQINTEMVKQFANAEHKVIANAEHSAHLEEPSKFLSVINQSLKQF